MNNLGVGAKVDARSVAFARWNMETEPSNAAKTAKTPEGSGAWQPFTARGVAAFGAGSWHRLLLIQLLVALFAASATVWWLVQACFPAIEAALAALPDSGQVYGGKLAWPGGSPILLAENHFLSFSVDLDHQGNARSTAHLNLVFSRDDWSLSSIFGRAKWRYAKEYIVAFNRPELTPWWGAWRVPTLAIAAGLVVSGLMVCWQVLGLVYAFPVWLLAFFTDRQLKLSQAPRVAGAALMPGAVLLGICIFLYSGAALDLLQIALAAVLQLLTGWAYLVAAVVVLPRCGEIAKGPNPFAAGKSADATAPPRG